MHGCGLLIERKLGESFRIGDAVVTIVRLGDKRVKVRIRAPLSVHVARIEEDGERVRRETP